MLFFEKNKLKIIKVCFVEKNKVKIKGFAKHKLEISDYRKSTVSTKYLLTNFCR